MFGLLKKTYSLHMDEKEVTTVLRVINQKCGCQQLYVDSCGWAKESEKWFILFNATEKQYGNIVKELKKIGHFKVEVRDGVDIVFEKDS